MKGSPMNTQYTPGPWKWVGDTLTSETSGDVCIVEQWAQGEEGPDGQELADARLIAASVELLEALKRLSTRFPISPVCGIDAEEWNAAEQARQAIAKATQGA
jgi:hypothetical protein